MTSELVAVDATVVDYPADERELLRRRAEAYAVRWLHGYTSPLTRNRYGRDIGLSSGVLSALPGGPANPAAPAEWSWITWALDHGIDPAGKLLRAEAEAYVHALSGFGKNVRKARWTAVCAFYRFLRVEEVVSCDPGELVNRRTMGLAGTDPSATVPLHPRQVQALYLAASLPARSRARNQAMLAVLAATGCRVAELVGILLEDYRPQVEGHVLLRLRGKGGKQRWVTLPPVDAALVASYLTVRVGPRPGTAVTVGGQASPSRPVQPLFTTANGNRLHVNTVTRMLRTIARQPKPGGRPEVREAARLLAPIAATLHPHQLRHSYVVVAEAAGVPLSRIQADLGHASVASTQTYLHAADGAEHSAARVVSDIYHANEH